MTKSQIAAAALLILAWGLSGLAVMVGYGVADMYAAEESPVRSGTAVALEVAGLPLMLVVLLCLGAVVAASSHRVLLRLAVATVPISFLAAAAAGVGGAL
jgi:hypothetical protein